jgi:hypothetical protein
MDLLESVVRRVKRSHLPVVLPFRHFKRTRESRVSIRIVQDHAKNPYGKGKRGLRPALVNS